MFDTELRSFVTKFHQLRRAGFDAHLNLHARGGRYWVGLCAQLGEAEQQPHRQQEKPRLRSPAYRRRQERRKAARQAAAASSEVSAAEAKTEDVAAAEVKESAPLSKEAQDAAEATEPPNEAEKAKLFSESLCTENKIHGNVRLVVSDQLLNILQPGIDHHKGENFSHKELVKKLWTYIQERGLSSGSDHFSKDDSLAKVFKLPSWVIRHGPQDTVQFSEMKRYLKYHVFYRSTKVSIYDEDKEMLSRNNNWPSGISFENILQ